MIRRPPRSTLFPTRRSSDLLVSPAAPGSVPDRVTSASVNPNTGSLKTTSKVIVAAPVGDRKSTRLNSSHSQISYAVFCLKKKKKNKKNKRIIAKVVKHE